ncbi:unnamed protein product [Orchesella dallaii]|uniref:Uncharacterized protein n=1 Tax=Orchesella dallaii TaxID=48710 RepID=A0ABP1SBA4_9HEXA
MDSNEVKVTFRNVSSKAECSSRTNEILSDLNKLDLLNEKCNDVEDKLNYNDGREANAFDKMGNYYGRHKDIFLFNNLLRNKEMRVKIDELLRIKDDELKKRFFTRMQIYLKRLEQGEQEASGFLGGPVKQAFFTGPLGDQKQNLNLNLGKDGSLNMGTIYDGNEIKRLKVHANGAKLMTVLKNERGQKNYSFTKATTCHMQIQWLAASSQNCLVTLKIEGGKNKVTQAMINGEFVKLDELIPLAKENKGLLIREKKLEKLLQNCFDKGQFFEMKSELETETLIVKQLPQQQNKDLEVEQFFAEVAKLLETYKKDGIKDALGKLRSHYGRNHNNVFLLKSILKDELLRERMLSLIQDKLGADEEDTLDKLETKLDKMLDKFLEGEKLVKEILEFEGMDAFSGGRESGMENLNLNILENESIMQVLFQKAQASGLRRVKVFGHGQRLLTITTNGQGQRNYKFREVGDCNWEVKVCWEAKGGLEGELKGCQLILHLSYANLSLSTCSVNGQPIHPTLISELAKENKRMLLNGKSLHLVLEKILEGGGEPIHIKSIGSQEKLLLRNSISSGEEETEATLKLGLEKLYQRLENPEFNSKEEVNQFDLLAKYYGRELGEDPFLFQGMIEDPHSQNELIAAIQSKFGEKQAERFVKRLQIYLEWIESGKRDASLFLGDDKKVRDAFFHGYHVPHPPEVKRNVHENLNVSVSNWPNAMIESGDNLFSKMIPRMWEEQSELRRVKVYGNGGRLVDILKLEGGERDYTFHSLHSQSEFEMQIDWVARDKAKEEEPKEVECTLLLYIKQGKIRMGDALLNQNHVDNGKMVELAKQNKIVFLDGKSLAMVLEGLESADADPDEVWEVLADSNEN